MIGATSGAENGDDLLGLADAISGSDAKTFLSTLDRLGFGPDLQVLDGKRYLPRWIAESVQARLAEWRLVAQ